MRTSARGAPRWIAAVLLLTLASGIGGSAWASTEDGRSWWLRLRSTAYSFQTEDVDQLETDRLGFYQHYDASMSGLSDGRLDLRVSGRFADDLRVDERLDTRERLYVGYAQLSADRLETRARLGRQFLSEGVTQLTLDGLWLSLRPRARTELRLFAGSRAPFSRIYEVHGMDEEGVFGGRLLVQPARRVRLAASYSYRKSGGEVAAAPLGLEATLQPARNLRAVLRTSYDMEQELSNRNEILAQWRPRPNLPLLSLQFLDRRPAIDANSWFARFEDLERVKVARASLRYEDSRGYGAELEWFGGFLEDHNSYRIGGALLSRWGRLGYSARLGDQGEESRFYGDVRYRFVPWLCAQAGATLATYTVINDAPDDDERELVTAFARLRANLRQGLRFTAELQSLENPFYSEDIRLLLGLDFSIGRGASNFGWGTGGWFE